MSSCSQMKLIRKDFTQPANLLERCQDCPFVLLTSRELEVLVMIADGLGVKAIADRLGINHKTAEAHRQHLYQKLGTKSEAVLTRYAILNGLSSL